ncbi:RNA-binding protein [Tabrizicola oligotrophica]|uniref:RNA-binding protein n=1 Tax=Tabrizicola oligotrophica TaxID=2710650 RepID=A0A6M0QRK6_9RHOB|nr:RNA-binding protein [Tabrizicola oligotrophica]NEY90036.1 RNA-binding protein [Tabrizicola oligotrophica]
MTRGGREKDQDDPERKCIVSGESQPKAGLVRFCIGPDNQVVPDILGRLPGRGIYVAADRAAIAKAATKGLFSRAARQPVKVPDGLPDLVEALLARRVVDLISMCRKANAAVMGYEKVKDWLASGKARVLVQASDGSERGKTKLRPPEGEGTFIGLLTAGEMGLAFGRERAIHAALGAGGLTTRVVEEAARLSGLRVQAEKQDGGETAMKDM